MSLGPASCLSLSFEQAWFSIIWLVLGSLQSCARYISQATQIELDTFHQHAVAWVINSVEFLKRAKEDLVLERAKITLAQVGHTMNFCSEMV